MQKLFNYSMRGPLRRNENRESKYQKYVDEFISSKQKNMFWQCENFHEFDSVRRAFRRIIYKMSLNDNVCVRLDYNDLVVGLEYYDILT